MLKHTGNESTPLLWHLYTLFTSMHIIRQNPKDTHFNEVTKCCNGWLFLLAQQLGVFVDAPYFEFVISLSVSFSL